MNPTDTSISPVSTIPDRNGMYRQTAFSHRFDDSRTSHATQPSPTSHDSEGGNAENHDEDPDEVPDAHEDQDEGDPDDQDGDHDFDGVEGTPPMNDDDRTLVSRPHTSGHVPHREQTPHPAHGNRPRYPRSGSVHQLRFTPSSFDTFSQNDVRVSPSEESPRFRNEDFQTRIRKEFEHYPIEHISIVADLLEYCDGREIPTVQSAERTMFQILEQTPPIPALPANSLTSGETHTTQEHGRMTIDKLTTGLKDISLHKEIVYRMVVHDFPIEAFQAKVAAIHKEHMRRIQSVTRIPEPNEAEITHEIRQKYASRVREARRRIDDLYDSFAEQTENELNATASLTRAEKRDMRVAILNSYEMDPTMRRYQRSLENLEHDIQDDITHTFTLRLQQYRNTVKSADALSEASQLKVIKTNMIVLDQVLHLCRTLINHIARITSEYLQNAKLAALHNVINGAVILPLTRRQVTQPLRQSDLPGIYKNLIEKFYEPTIKDFVSALEHILKYKNHTGSFTNSIVKFEEISATWAKIMMWEKFMTPDAFFTINCILSWPDDSDRHKLFKKLLNAMEDPDTLEKIKQSTTHTLGPLFQTVKDASKLVDKAQSTSRFGANNNNNTRKPNKPNASPERNHANHVAYAVQTINPKEKNQTDLVRRPAQLFANQNGTNKPYTATFGLCGLCHPNKHMDDTKPPHEPKCSTDLCTRCGLYGHQQSHCVQAESGFKTAIQARNPPRPSNDYTKK